MTITNSSTPSYKWAQKELSFVRKELRKKRISKDMYKAWDDYRKRLEKYLYGGKIK
jgi:hypothetical protein